MELFGGAVDELYRRYNQSNQTCVVELIFMLMIIYTYRVCGSYEQLEYWSNGFDDFYVSVNR